VITLTTDPIALLMGVIGTAFFILSGYVLMTNPRRIWGPLMDRTGMTPATARLHGFASFAVGIALLCMLTIGLLERFL
jgi:hypothetical protein